MTTKSKNSKATDLLNLLDEIGKLERLLCSLSDDNKIKLISQNNATCEVPEDYGIRELMKGRTIDLIFSKAKEIADLKLK